MIQTVYTAVAGRVEDFCSSDAIKYVFESSTKELLKEILIAGFRDEPNREGYSALIRRIQSVCDCSAAVMSDTIGSVAYDLYDRKSPEMIQWSFHLAISLCPTMSTRNNLAYINRHHRNQLCSSPAEIIDLLIDGVQKQEPFSLINMALTFVQMLGKEEDWHLADRMIALIREDRSDVRRIVRWWDKLAAEGETEGPLVLQWLNRHGKLPTPLSFTQMASIQNLKTSDTQIPRWIFEKYSET